MTPLEIPEDITTSTNLQKPLFFWKGLGYGLLILVAQMIVGSLVFGLGAAIFGTADQTTLMNLVMAIALPGSFLLAVFIVLRIRPLAPTAFQWKPSFFKLLLLGLVMLLGLDYILGELMTFLPNYDQLLEDYSSMFEGIDMIYLLIGGVIVGPICEEIIFRGIIEEGFLQTYNSPGKAILFSAMIFGGIHLVPLQVLNAFLAGLLLGWIYWKTRSLWIVIIMHILNNYMAFSFMDVDTHSFRAYFSNDLTYYSSIIVALAVMYFAYQLFERVVSEEMMNEK